MSSAKEGSQRVGYVLKMYPRLSETFILEEILGLEAAGTQVAIFSLKVPQEGRFHADLARVRAEVHYLSVFRSASAWETFERAARCAELDAEALPRAFAFAASLPEARRLEAWMHGLELACKARALGLQHLHAHFLSGAAEVACIAHLLTGIPFSVTSHAKDIYRETVEPERYAAIAERARAIVTVCEANRRFICERLVAGRAVRVERIYNGLDLEALPAARAAREPRTILAVGRLVEKKGFAVLLRAVALLQAQGVPLRCEIAGDGEEREALQALSRELELESAVRFLGAVPRGVVLERMACARVLAAPCIAGEDGNQDALPTVLLEALALGLPCVSTPVGGIEEIVERGVEGLLVPAGDPRALADALRRLLEDEELWKRCAAAGPIKARARFDRRRTLPQLRALFFERAHDVRPSGVLARSER